MAKLTKADLLEYFSKNDIMYDSALSYEELYKLYTSKKSDSHPNNVVDTVGNQKIIVDSRKQPGRPAPEHLVKEVTDTQVEKTVYVNHKGQRITKHIEISRIKGKCLRRRLIEITKTSR